MAQDEMTAGQLAAYLHGYLAGSASDWNQATIRYGGSTWQVKNAPGEDAAFLLIRKRKGKDDEGFKIAVAKVTAVTPTPAAKPTP